MAILELREEHARPCEFDFNVEIDHGFHEEFSDDLRIHKVIHELTLII